MNEGYKKAALRIHCLSESDKHWVLSNLPDRERQELKVLLAQLDDMKIPGGYPAFSELMDSASINYPGMSAEQPSLPSKTEIINGIGSSMMAALLEGEPDWLIALILYCHDWNWTESYIRSLDSERRARIYALIKEMPVHLPPKLRETAIELLAEVFSASQPKAKTGGSSRFEALFTKLDVEITAKTSAEEART